MRYAEFENIETPRLTLRDIRMDGVKMPLVINSFYFCDADGKTERVQSREKQPVDETTPEIRTVCFERVKADGCKACAVFVKGSFVDLNDRLQKRANTLALYKMESTRLAQ